MEFGLLGTLEVRADDGPLPLGRPKERALLALLLLHADRAVSRERLIDELWGEAPPDSAVKALQGYVSQLRKLLPDGMLLTQPPGYRLVVEREAVDLGRFEQLVAAARGAAPARAASLLREALALWRGPALAEFRDEPFARAEAGRLEELRLSALEERVEADLALGRHAEVVGELEALIAEHPARERLHGQLMLALYRSGRQAEALEAYREARATLHGLGLEPGAALRELEKRILTQDAGLEPAPGKLLADGLVVLPGALVPTPPFPFVGRTDELTALRSQLHRAEAGEGGLVLLSAEAGGGKTRLVRELAHEAAARGVLVLYGASDAAVSTPYEPLREWLEFLFRVCDRDALAACVGDHAAQLSLLSPGLGGHTLSGAGPQAPDRDLLQGAAVDLISRLGRLQPLLLVADDVHWADAETLHLLRRLARIAPEGRVLVVATYRDRGEDVGPALSELLAELARLDGLTRIALGRLSDEEVGSFIRASAQAAAPDELVAAIGELTGGTPLLLSELWRDLRERDAVEVTSGGVRLSRPLAELRGPERLRDGVRQRLSHLPHETAATLELAAVAGPTVELRVLAEAAGLDRRDVATTVGALVRTGLVEELPQPAPACRFTHELVRRAVYDRLDSIRRAELHLRVGEALERTYGPDQGRVLPELASHFTLAAPIAGVERAVDYNLRAASAAIAAAAFEEAVAHLATALELGIDDPRERARTQVELAHLLYETGRTAEADAMLATSLNAATGLGERGVAARALVDRLGHRSGDPALDGEELRQVAEAAIATLGQLGDARGLAAAGVYLGIAVQRLGRLEESVRVAERALADADGCDDEAIRRRLVSLLCSSLSGGPTPVVEGIGRCEELLASSRGDRIFEAIVQRFLARLTAMAGRFEEALAHVRTSGRVLDTLDATSGWVWRWAAADAKELAGDHAGAEQELIGWWQSYREFGQYAVDQRAMHAAYALALLYCDLGRWDEAADRLAYGADVPVSCPTTPATYRHAVTARLAARDRRFAEARARARQAVACAELSDALNLRARAWLAVAEVERAAGADAKADAAVAKAIRLYEVKGNVAAAAQLRTAAAT